MQTIDDFFKGKKDSKIVGFYKTGRKLSDGSFYVDPTCEYSCNEFHRIEEATEVRLYANGDSRMFFDYKDKSCRINHTDGGFRPTGFGDTGPEKFINEVIDENERPKYLEAYGLFLSICENRPIVIKEQRRVNSSNCIIPTPKGSTCIMSFLEYQYFVENGGLSKFYQQGDDYLYDAIHVLTPFGSTNTDALRKNPAMPEILKRENKLLGLHQMEL